MRRVALLALVATTLAPFAGRTPTAVAATGDHTAWLFAEGTTRPGFDEYLVLANPGTQTVHVDVAFLVSGSPEVPAAVDVPAGQRVTLVVHDIVGRGRDLGASVQSNGEILAERLVYFRYGDQGWAGASAAAGAEEARTVWSFAEGTTRPGFETYLTISNPGGSEASGTATFLIDGASPITTPVTVPARGRATLAVHQFVPAGLDFGIRLDTAGAVVAERASYFDYQGRIKGGSAVLGSAPATRFVFAEGTTRAGFDTYVLLGNPSPQPADVTVRYLQDGFPTEQDTITVAGNARATVVVGNRLAADRDMGFDVSSTTPIVAERAVYALYRGIYDGGHAVVGGRAPSTRWGFGEGTTREGFDQYLTLSNPAGADVDVAVQYLRAGAPLLQRTVSVPVGARRTVSLPDVLGRGIDTGIRVDAPTAVVAERVSYQNYQGGTGAHAEVGVPDLVSAPGQPPPEEPPPGQVTPVVDEVIIGYDHVWSVVFAPDGRIFFSERTTGRIYVFRMGEPAPSTPIVDLPSCNCGEGGLMGLALSPNFTNDGFLYAMYTFSSAPTPTGYGNRIVRLRVTGATATLDTTIVDNIPGGTTHDGGRLRFGPDGFLYATTGDGRNQPNPAQDTTSLAGKILRLDPAGGPAAGNPFNNEVWSYGHRNPQGIDWAADGRLVSTEHGPGCLDEVNLIERGGNYGWTGNEACPPPAPPGSIAPLKTYSPTIAPSGASFYESSVFPQWTGDYFFACLKFSTSPQIGRELHRVRFAADGRTITEDESLYENDYGRLRDVAEAPDGTIWFTTDNGGDDGLYRIRPA